MLKAHDIILAFYLSGSAAETQNEIASALGLSQAEVSNMIRRLKLSRLLLQDSRTVVIPKLIELCVHGVKYVFPARIGRRLGGIPTAALAPPLKGRVSGEEGLLIWPSPKGQIRATSIEPIHSCALHAAEKDLRMHELLALLDAIRVGRNRMRQLAETELRERLLSTQVPT